MFCGVLSSKFISLAMIWGRKQLWATSVLEFCILFAFVHWAVLSLCFVSRFLWALILVWGKYEAIAAKFNSSFHWSFSSGAKAAWETRHWRINKQFGCFPCGGNLPCQPPYGKGERDWKSPRVVRVIQGQSRSPGDISST